MNHDDFLQKLDAAIIAGGSNSQLARELGVGEVTIRRRKARLGQAGLLPTTTQRVKREAHDADHQR